jgi:hypothetical protein
MGTSPVCGSQPGSTPARSAAVGRRGRPARPNLGTSKDGARSAVGASVSAQVTSSAPVRAGLVGNNLATGRSALTKFC